MIEFVTVTDYLFLLRRITQIVALARQNAMYYLAAAVSDFYIPASKMVFHVTALILHVPLALIYLPI